MWDKLRWKHTGDTCVIIGNGPSLRSVPDEFLKKYWTFGTNRIFLRMVPDYYVCVNPLVLNQDRLRIQRLDTLKFMPEYFGMLGRDVVSLKMTGDVTFGNPHIGFYEGWTVTYVCMQIAMVMDFDTVLLVGVDHRYEVPDVSGGKEIIAHGPDPNHFSPAYFSDGYVWHAPDLKKSEEAYRMALMEYARHGKRIVNLTEDTALNVFERDELENYV